MVNFFKKLLFSVPPINTEPEERTRRGLEPTQPIPKAICHRVIGSVVKGSQARQTSHKAAQKKKVKGKVPEPDLTTESMAMGQGAGGAGRQRPSTL